MPKPNRGGWKTCSRGHKFRGTSGCPTCWKGHRVTGGTRMTRGTRKAGQSRARKGSA